MRLCLTMCESTEQRICIKFCFKIRKKPQWKRINYCSKHTVKMQWVVHKCLTSSVDLKRVEPPLKATPARDDPFFDSEGIVHHEYAPDGQTINKEFYLEVLRCLHELVRRKRPEKWWDGDWILHHDNVPAHTSHLVQHFLAKHDTAQLRQPPYSRSRTV